MRVTELSLRPATLFCLHTASIVNVKQLTSYSCTELMEHPTISMAELYEVIRQINKRGLMLPTDWGWVRRPSPRNLELFRLRFVEGLTLTEVGEQTGITNGRVGQLLHLHFGTSKWPPTAKDRQHLRQARESRRAKG